MRENNYYFDGPVTADRVLDAAAEILAARVLRGDQYCNPEATKTYLSCKLKHHEREVFAVMFLDNQHRLIAFEELFFGTIDSASVYPREVLKAALKVNAAALILAHNHPSGDATPSQADKQITQRLKEALALVDIRVLDHIVVGDSAISFAERGLL
ncbi:DNA repair protein RadC [Vibrio cincinnatiensis]|uniref:RadC family protein n=1 Tax=Vibrio cincinnatiensis TaxID=675 RepID=UPI001EDE39FC|nr:DNA repair protein RadC [Vibrio cincinnatiensis]MCG3767446.1 DNA repair protein RadC [Vibrio cincinnatiensis]